MLNLVLYNGAPSMSGRKVWLVIQLESIRNNSNFISFESNEVRNYFCRCDLQDVNFINQQMANVLARRPSSEPEMFCITSLALMKPTGRNGSHLLINKINILQITSTEVIVSSFDSNKIKLNTVICFIFDMAIFSHTVHRTKNFQRTFL